MLLSENADSAPQIFAVSAHSIASSAHAVNTASFSARFSLFLRTERQNEAARIPYTDAIIRAAANSAGAVSYTHLDFLYNIIAQNRKKEIFFLIDTV